MIIVKWMYLDHMIVLDTTFASKNSPILLEASIPPIRGCLTLVLGLIVKLLFYLIPLF